LIAGATGVAAGLVVIVMLVVPVTVRFSVPLADGFVVVSPRYCALIAWVPTANAGAVGTAVPATTLAAVPVMVAPSNSWTIPVGVPPVTATLNVNGVPEAIRPFVPFVTVNFVTVVILGGGITPPLLPLHPAVRPSMQTSPSPNAARYFLRPPGRNSRNSAAKPVPALSVHHPLPPIVGGTVFASSIRSSRALEAVKTVEVAVTEHMSWLVAAVAAVTLIFSGEGVQLTPGGKVAAVGVTATMPVNPPLGVTVTVSVDAAPVAELRINGCGL
jgi:hypothetical protein